MQLKGVNFKDLLVARAKKLILDMTSIKFESIIFVAWGIMAGKINDIVGLSYIAVAVGMREFVDYKDKSKTNGG